MLGLESKRPSVPSSEREQDVQERVEAQRRVDNLTERVSILTLRLRNHEKRKHW